jgi:hypothetical protein
MSQRLGLRIIICLTSILEFLQTSPDISELDQESHSEMVDN